MRPYPESASGPSSAGSAAMARGVQACGSNEYHGIPSDKPRMSLEYSLARLLACRRLRDRLGGDRPYPRQLPQRSLGQPGLQSVRRKLRHHLGRPAERPDPIGRRARPLELERDLPQRPDRVHRQALEYTRSGATRTTARRSSAITLSYVGQSSCVPPAAVKTSRSSTRKPSGSTPGTGSAAPPLPPAPSPAAPSHPPPPTTL